MGSSDAEDQFEVASTVVFGVAALVILYFAIRALCLIGTVGCCICETCSCCARCCKGCISCLTCGASKNDKDEEKEAQARKLDPYHSFGNWASMLLVVLAIIIALVWQFYIANNMDDWDAIEDAWNDNCDPKSNKYPKCIEYAATYRVSFAAVIVFALMAMICYKKPSAHDRGWDLKLLLFAGLLIAFIFAKNSAFDDHGYVWVARIGAFIFLIFQQIILIDYAYSFNEQLSALGFAKQQESGDQGMNFYLGLLLALALLIYAAAFIGIVLLFVYFSGCSNSETFMSITLVVIVLLTLLQLFSDPELGHNLLVSSVVAAYSVYLTYVAVSSNPIEHCNPLYEKSNNVLAIIIGLGVTFISLCATVYFASGSMTNLLHSENKARPSIGVAEVLTSDVSSNTAKEYNKDSKDPEAASGEDEEPQEDVDGGRAWKFNVVMVLISMYWGMVLTNWGNSADSSSNSSPTAGKVTAWINIVACWVCMGIYMWTLVAPRLFPNRDFSAN